MSNSQDHPRNLFLEYYEDYIDAKDKKQPFKDLVELRPKVKALLPKIAEAIIAIEIHSLERQ